MVVQFLVGRVAERLARIDVLALLSERRRRKREASTEDFDLDAQPSLEQSMEILKVYAQKRAQRRLSDAQVRFRGSIRPTRFCWEPPWMLLSAVGF